MLPIKKILWTTDFSEASKSSLPAAEELALQFEADLFVLHVVGPIPGLRVPDYPTAGPARAGFDVAAYQAELEKDARESLHEIIEKQINKKVRAKPLIAHGDAAKEIVHAADDRDADLIVISTHGRTGWKHLLFGSVAEHVVRHSRVPVLVIQSKSEQDE
jgi:nucleotide-binding universal stress UspA family protein